MTASAVAREIGGGVTPDLIIGKIQRRGLCPPPEEEDGQNCAALPKAREKEAGGKAALDEPKPAQWGALSLQALCALEIRRVIPIYYCEPPAAHVQHETILCPHTNGISRASESSRNCTPKAWLHPLLPRKLAEALQEMPSSARFTGSDSPSPSQSHRNGRMPPTTRLTKQATSPRQRAKVRRLRR